MARRRARSRRVVPAADAFDVEAARRSLCATMFADSASIETALSHEVTGSFAIEPHTHRDLIQFDLIDGCAGQVHLEGRSFPIHGVTLMVAYPGVEHGYSLSEDQPPASVCLFRLRVGPDWHAMHTRPLSPLRTRLPKLDRLSALMHEAVERQNSQGMPSLAVAQLAQAVCLWSAAGVDLAMADGMIPGRSGLRGESVSDRVRQAIETLGRRYHDPPSLTELARSACISPRHFTRCFLEDFNCSPHAYLTARRLDAARSLLLRPAMRVNVVADELGFSSPAAFSRWFTHLVGQSPRAFQRCPQIF